jgi:hypothetical protein
LGLHLPSSCLPENRKTNAAGVETMKNSCGVFVTLCVLLAAGGILGAQTATTGLISGTVSDTSGAVVPGAG